MFKLFDFFKEKEIKLFYFLHLLLEMMDTYLFLINLRIVTSDIPFLYTLPGGSEEPPCFDMSPSLLPQILSRAPVWN